MGAVAKVVIDTNIFISAFGWDGKPEAVVQLMEQRKVINFTTNEIYAELQRVVAYPKLKFSPTLQVNILEFVFSWSCFVQPNETVAVITDDPDDDKFLSCAVAANASAIISGDPHLLLLGSYREIPIMTPAQFSKSIADRLPPPNLPPLGGGAFYPLKRSEQSFVPSPSGGGLGRERL
jgi:putative PIN family toxin of toxin-antitoxin system